MTTLYGQILDYDTFRDDLQRGANWVFAPSRSGARLFRRARLGRLERVRLPLQLDFIDEVKRRIALVDNATFEIKPLPCNWQCRQERRGVRDDFLAIESIGVGIGINDVDRPCLDGSCGAGRGTRRGEYFESDVSVRQERFEEFF